MIEENSDNEELCEHYRFAGKMKIPLRVDKFLMNFIENATEIRFSKLPKREIF